MLVPSEEAAVLRTAAGGAERLDEVTRQIFQGLITSADDVYVLDDRGWRGGRRLVWSRASEREVELEPDLLHPLASGVDVERYAFRPLGSLLLFPYQLKDGQMRLLTQDELSAFGMSDGYLREHEVRLRRREDGAMDHEGWYAFSRTQSLGLHDLPKLGVAATVHRLEIAADLKGTIYFHNVRVNGILGRSAGLPLTTLLVLLNSRLLDSIFRRTAAVHANDYYAANKQFIARLPIRAPEGSEADAFAELGQRLHELSRDAASERAGFLDWLATTLGTRRAALPGFRQLELLDRLSGDELIALLSRNRARLGVDPRKRTLADLIRREHRTSTERLAPISAELTQAERAADETVCELYRLPTDQRRLVEAEYE